MSQITQITHTHNDKTNQAKTHTKDFITSFAQRFHNFIAFSLQRFKDFQKTIQTIKFPDFQKNVFQGKWVSRKPGGLCCPVTGNLPPYPYV